MPPGRPRKPVTLPPGAQERAVHIRGLREQRDAAKDKLSADTKVFVDRCVASGIPVRDIAWLIGITPQRVSQIARKS